MAKLIFSTQIYNELPLGALYEIEVEEALKQQAKDAYPGFIFSKFKCLIESDFDTRKADFALVDENYRSWWVCELETANHSLESHVLPQVRTFTQGRYGAAAVGELMASNPHFDRQRLEHLVRTEQPGVLVVVNKYSDSWARAVASEGAHLAVFEIFRSETGQFAFRINGYTPKPPLDHLSICDADPKLPKFLRVRSPAAVPVVGGERYPISVDGAPVEWRAVRIQDALWFTPIGSVSLPKPAVYALSCDAAGNFSLSSVPRGSVGR